MTPTSPDPDRKIQPRTSRAPGCKPIMARISGTGGPSGKEFTVAVALGRLRKAELKVPFQFWAGDDATALPGKVAEMREQLAAWMTDPQRIVQRAQSLQGRERAVLEAFLAAPRHRRTKTDLVKSAGAEVKTGVDALKRVAILFDDEGEAEDAWVLPRELADRLLAEEAQSAGESEIFCALTLKGNMERRYAGPNAARPMPPSRLREMFKMYANEAQAVARIERLPEGLRDLVGKVVLEFGGLLPRRFFERMKTELPHWNQRRWAKIMGESLVGTVERLELGPYGIQHDDDTLIVFNEVTLAWFKRVAVPSDPDAPHDNCSLGVDVVSNISRFFGYIIDHQVRFTVKGEIFKTTEKRILTELIPNPGRELERGEVLQFIFHFAARHGFIEATGERTFKLTSAGREWEAQDLDGKLNLLFRYVTEDFDPMAESMHQPAMRRLLLKMTKRLEIGVWYDVMYLPFLARNAYLAQLDGRGVAEEVARVGSSGVGASEDLQRMSWNLVGWVRKRLYLLGIVDLGYDGKGHPVAMRLTHIGARVLGMVEGGSATPAPGAIGRLIVTADFEVMLFGNGDDADLTHDLDRFADRVKDGTLQQFRLSDKSVHRGLVEGLTLSRMFEILNANARTPVPQNVIQSIRGWADQAGLLTLDGGLVVRSKDPLALSKFVRDAGIRPFVESTLDSHSVRLKGKTSRSRYRTLFRDLGYLIEIVP